MSLASARAQQQARRWWHDLIDRDAGGWAVVAMLVAGVVSGAGARVGCVVPGEGTPIRDAIDGAGDGDMKIFI